MPITALPTPPSRSDPTNFAVRGDAFLGALPTFQAEANALAAAMNLNSTTDSSTSSVTIATGAATFTVTAGKSFQPGMYLIAADAAAPSTNSVFGQVTSYSGTALVMNIISIRGGGTRAAWVISQSSAGGLAAGDYQAQTSILGTTTGASTAYVLNPTPALGAYAVGQSFMPQFHVASGANPTLQVSGLATPPQLVRQVGVTASGTAVYANIAAGEIPAGHRSRVTLISTTQAWVEELPDKSGLVLLQTATPTVAVANVIFAGSVFTSGEFKTYKLMFKGVKPTTSGAVLMSQMSSDGGATFYGTGYTSASQYANDNNTAGSTAGPAGTTATQFSLVSSVGLSTDAQNGGADGEITFFNMRETANVKRSISQIVYHINNGVMQGCIAYNSLRQTLMMNGVSLYFNTGNIAAGSEVSLYGVR